MPDQFADEGGGEGAIQEDGVPVALVHVVAGEDGVLFLPEGDGAVGVALEVHAGRVFLRGGEGEELAVDFEDKDVRSEGSGGLHLRKREAQIAGGGEVHEGCDG